MRPLVTVLGVLTALAVVGYGAWRLVGLYESTPPSVTFVEAPPVVGRKAAVDVLVQDEGTGLRTLEVRLLQSGREKVLLAEDLSAAVGEPVSYEARRTLRFDPREAELRDGPAELLVRAADASRRNDNRGNVAEATLAFEVETRPPTIEVLSDQHNVAQGGSQMVAYRVGEDAVHTAVRVGDHEFPSFPSPAEPRVHVSLFAIPTRTAEGPEGSGGDLEPVIVAEDALGNRAEAAFYHKLLPKQFPSVDVRVPAALIEKIRREFPVAPSLDDAAAFVSVNDQRRQEDHVRLAEILAETSPVPLWSGAFLRLPNSQRMSDFAEARTYLWEGARIDHQDHFGIDLASIANSPVPAAADGAVSFTGDLGIYGNTVILDHGLGLATLYGHLSSIAVEPGQTVTRGQSLGRTGITGLALGDHLHYGVYVDGVPVDPIEWWDPSWQRARLDPKLEIWRRGPPAQPGEGAERAGSAAR